MIVACEKCKEPFPEDSVPYICSCGGQWDIVEFPEFDPVTIDNSRSGMWKYSKSFGLDKGNIGVTLGEGGTPLVQIDSHSGEAFLKLEHQNPTASYKDRGTSVLVSFLQYRKVKEAVEDSSGNAGASFAAYTANAGISAEVFIPESASGPKRVQIEKFGAKVTRVPGPRSEAAKAVLRAANNGRVYASHAYMPFVLTGIASIAYEIVEDLGEVPGTVIAPVGHGGLLYGVMHGFDAMVKAGVIKNEPYYVGVQASACAPIVTAYDNHSFQLSEIISKDTVAEGVKVVTPLRGISILKKMNIVGGKMVSINESALIAAYHDLALKGFYVEPTSALVWAALSGQTGLQKPIVAIITGSGYKSIII